MQLNETFSGDFTLIEQDSLNESNDFSSVIDGTNIIGLVEGQFFQPDGMSRNKRWYSRKLWENVLACADVRSRLANRTMYGEIGHSDGPVTDMTLRDGTVSHIVAALWIDEKGRGMGRAYILDTPQGRLLKTYLGAKSKLKVSTRGEGVYLDGQFHDGCPIIDPDTYELQTVDFVLNPGFMETNAKLTVKPEIKQENFTPEPKQQVHEQSTKEEGDYVMDAEKYIQKLEEELKELKSENKSLSEELKSKEHALLESQFGVNEEIKKLKEAYAPYKKMNASAKTLNETLKKAQTSLQKANDKNAKLTEELKAYKDRCGEAISELDEALEMSKKALETVKAYQEIGTVEQLKELMERSETLVPKLKNLAVLAEYKKLGSVKDLKSLVEKCETSLPKLKELSILEDYKALGSPEEIKELSQRCEAMLPKLQKLSALKEYRKLGTVKDIQTLMEKCKENFPKLKKLKVLEEYKALGSVKELKTLSEKCEKILPKLKELKDARKLAENVEKLMPKLKKVKSLEESVKQAKHVIKQYLETVGNIKKAKELVESRKETIKKVNVKEALDISKKFGCTVENAAKMIKKYGADKTNKLLESELAKRKPAKTKKLAESTDLVKEASKIEPQKVNTIVKPETKSANDFVKSGMITNKFNLEALGKELKVDELTKLDGTKVDGLNQAQELLNRLKGVEPEVEKAPATEPEKTPADAEKAVKNLLK